MKHIFEYNAFIDEDYNEFIRSIKRGNLEEVIHFVNIKNVDPSKHESLALQQAADNGHADIIKFLLEDGRVDINAKDDRAVMYAAGSNHKEAIELLINDNICEEAVSHVYNSANWNGWHDILDMIFNTESGLNFAVKYSIRHLSDNARKSLMRVLELDSVDELEEALQLL